MNPMPLPQLSTGRRLSTRPELGFTLIELLTVIAIIGVLAAISVPIVKSSRTKAQDSRCVGNLRQIGVALLNYAADHKGQLPAVGHFSSSAYFNRDPRYLQSSLVPYLNVHNAANWSTNSTDATYSPIFDCPGYKGENANKFANTCYRMNASFTGKDGVLYRPFGNMTNAQGSTNLTPQKIAVVPMDAWAVRDNDLSDAATNHGAYRNAVFFDGRVGRLNLNNTPL
ncbi:MAG: hypothetical protein K0R17_1834 [Rariglobus sp.]|jgi:prepilin-type N-terminal cleavage/methylation domain-containing protein|nr:hypothetical protein [Rariglobus sp.]